MNLTLHQFDLPLRHTFTISRESTSSQPTLIVQLSEQGCDGFGEATTNTYYNVTFKSLTTAIETLRPLLASVSMASLDPVSLWERLATPLADNPFALCAIDQATHDLWGKLQGQPLYKLWGLKLENVPPSCFTIGIDTIDVMIDKLAQMPGWPVYKIKLGTDHDVEIIQALRQHTDATFRVDANCGWTVDQTLRNAEQLRALGVELIEQPLPADDWAGHRKLYQSSALPIMADESCIAESDVARCAGHFHAINIKLVKCGGLTPARRMIETAKRHQLQVMVGCMTESTVGISAIAQLLPMLDYVDMDGAALLADDIADGAKLDHGICQFPPLGGTGAVLL